jgi:hypothetical protein
LEIIDHRGEGIEATRYVFLGLDTLDPDRRDQVQHLRRGGEEVTSHCLRRTPNFVPRCFITPVEIWVEHMPLEHVPDGSRSVEVKDGSLAVVASSGNVVHNILRGKPLRSLRTYPGEEMDGITETYQKIGIVELDTLRGTEWETGEAQRLQAEFFPADWLVPIPLRLVEEQITARYNVHPLIGETMLRGCGQSRRWAQARLQAEHVLLDTRTRHEWTYTYSPIARSLLAQLEMTPRDQGWEPMMAQSNIHLAQAIANTQGGAGAGMDVNALATAIATAIITAQQQNLTPKQAVEQVQDEAPKMITCPACGEDVKAAGIGLHKSRWCRVLHPKASESIVE